MAAACASGAASAVMLGLNNYDFPGFTTGTFFGVRGNTVGQTFSRKFSAIDYKIQKQQLHREDIRDLVDLTTARMDIFFIVGTLLLAFCMTWYTDNEITTGSLPTWFSDIFLISNFGAVGYLLICVWFAMYAAIAARSIGVRLLTSYARVAFPDRVELEDIKVPIFFNTREYIKKKMRNMSWSSRKSAADGEEVVVMEGSPELACPTPTEVLSEDDQQHFRRILQEMPKWLIYDIWSRVSMTMGINQMLQALSYYILGVLWAKSGVIAIMSFVGINYLSYVMLWLDLGDNINGFMDLMGVIFLNLLPPTLAAVLLAWNSALSHEYVHIDDWAKMMLSLLATVCFWAHGLWLAYLMLQFRNAGQMGTAFKPGAYAQVLEWVDFHPVQVNVFEGLINKIKALEEKLEVDMKLEDERKNIDPAERAKLQPTYAAAAKALQDFVEFRPISHKFKKQPPVTPLGHAAKQYAMHVCTLYKVWDGAAEMAMAFQALSHELVQERLTSREKERINQMRATYLQHCASLELGIGSKAGDIKLIELEEAPLVHFEASHITEEFEEWIDTAGAGSKSRKAPWGSHEVLAFPQTMDEMETWEKLARSLYISKKSLASAKATVEAVPQQPDPETGIKPIQEWNGGHEPGLWQKSVTIPRPTDQADWLPQRSFNWFTRVVVLWWFLAGLFHALGELADEAGFTDKFAILQPDEEAPEETLLQMHWPSPSRLFKVSALHCSGGKMWVANKYSLYRAPDSLDAEAAELEELGGHNGVGAVLCREEESGNCHVLRQSSPNSTWTMAPLGHARHGAGQEVPVPSSWQLMTGVWDPDSCTSPDAFSEACDKAFVAGWDGATLSAATLSWDEEGRRWALLQRYDLEPSFGVCGNQSWSVLALMTGGLVRGHGCSTARLKKLSDSYSEVKALQMGAGGSTLTVLLGSGAVDVWDLSTGAVIERVRLQHKYTSMCHGEGNLYLGQDGDDGPGLVSVALPTKLSRKPQQPLVASAPGEDDGAEVSLLQGKTNAVHKRRRSRASMLTAKEETDQ